MIVSFIALALAHSAHAAPDAFVRTRGFYEQLRTALPKKANVKFMDQRALAAEERREGYLPPDQRDAVFRKVKLEQALAKYDEVDKDLLVMFVRDADTSELKRIQRKYPNLTLGDLRRLRLAVGKFK